MLNIDYERLADGRIAISASDFEDIMDVLMFDEAVANAGEHLPAEMVKRLIDGENPVRVWRGHRGFTQAELAAKASVSQATIAEIESGRKNGSVDTLKRIAAALNVDLDDII